MCVDKEKLARIESEVKFYSVSEDIKKPISDIRYIMVFFNFEGKTYLYGARKIYNENLNDSPLVKSVTRTVSIPVNEVVKDESGKYVHLLTESKIVATSSDLEFIQTFKTDIPPTASNLLAVLNSHIAIKLSQVK
jgi:hypothetical protein